MPIPVTNSFKAAQAADANLPVAQVSLVLGNYASAPAYGTTAVASSVLSTDYPASGAIDGDRTEINVGPSSGADNDVGKSSWQSSVAPDTTPQTLTLTFTQARAFNRIKLYSRNGHGCKTYYYQWWDGSTWHTFAATSDIVAPGQTSITPTYKLDTVDFPDIVTNMLRLVINHTQVAAETAQVVEIEVYRLVDITDRVKDVSISRSRDYKLSNPMASSCTITCINSDRFFSLNHIPTAVEAAAGFVNAELDANIGVQVSLGFNYFAASPETPSVFVGLLDRITTKPASRDAVLTGRDGMKTLINRIDSTKLTAGQDISFNLLYLLNRSNISTYETSLDSSGINIDFFFTDTENVLTSIRDLVEASVDAAFFFDESGIATYKFYAGNVPLSKIFTTQADWQSGSSTDIDTTAMPGDLLLDYTGVDARQPTTWGNSLAGWTTHSSGGASWTDNLGTNLEVSGPSASAASAYRSLSSGSGRWEFSTRMDQNATIFVQFQVQTITGANVGTAGYALFIDGTNDLAEILREDSPNPFSGVEIAGTTIPHQRGTGAHTWVITKDPRGLIRVLLDGTLIMSATDTTYATGNFYVIYAPIITAGPATGHVFFGDTVLYIPAATLSGVWTSPTIDTGANTSAYNTIMDTFVANGGSRSYQTRSSPDGATWSPYVSLGGGNTIVSPVQRYLEVNITLTGTPSTNGNPDLLDTTVNWTGSATSKKYPTPPSSFTFSFDSTLLSVDQELADNLGGDSSVLNDVSVQAQPLVLTGANTDTVWQATIGTPPVNVAPATPISVTSGQVLVIAPYVAGGMNISFMSGANPSAAVVTFAAGGAGTWSFTSIHPTLPVLTIVITHDGEITDLRLVGQVFQDAQYLQVQRVTDAISISKYGDRQQSISNHWVVSASVALDIATTIVSNFRTPTAYLPACVVRPTFSAQIGDRVTVADVNLDLSADYVSVGVTHKFAAAMGNGTAQTDMILLKVPAGS